MSIYGESSNQFRSRPSGWLLATFSLFSTLIGVTLGPLFFSLVRTVATRFVRADYLFNVHAPIGTHPSLGLFPLHSDHIVIGAAVAVAATAILTTAFVAVYPSSQLLASRLALYSISTAIIASGAIATTADLGVLRSLSRWRGMSEMASGGVLAAVVLALLLSVVWIERRTVSLLGNLFEIDNPVQRFGLWALRIPLPWAAFGALALLNRWWGGAIAAASVITATLVEDLVHYPSLRYETLERPKMYEGLAAVVILALALGAGSAWTFGLPAARLTPRALVLENGRVSLVPVSDLANRIQEETMPRLKMEWSKEK